MPEATAGRLRKRERTRREIYRTAMELFSERGYDGVTIEDICAGAGIAKATFFLHFPNKAALLRAFNEEVSATLAETLKDSEHLSAEEQLLLMSSVFENAFHSNAQVMRKMLADFMEQLALYDMARDVNESVLDLATQIIRRGQERGEFRRSVVPELASLSIVATWTALTTYWLDNPGVDTKGGGLAIMDIALNGIKATRPTRPVKL